MPVVAEARTCGQSQAGDSARIDVAHAALRGLESFGGDHWASLDGDPQFVLHPPATSRPCSGASARYRLVVRLDGPGVSSPCVYVDDGAGWQERSRLDLEATASIGEWATVVDLPLPARPLRLDPTDVAGPFRFVGATLQQMPGSLDDGGTGRAPGDAPSAASGCPGMPWSGNDDVYRRWVTRHDTLGARQRAALLGVVDGLPLRPLLSLVVVVDAARPLARELVETLLAQVYPDWELCVVHGGDLTRDAVALLATHAAASSRIRLVPAQGAVADEALVAAGVAVADGEWVALVGRDLRLAPHALLALVDAVARRPSTLACYADHDYLDASGQRHAPVFKPAWDPVLAASCDYLGPLVLRRRRELSDASGRPPALVAQARARGVTRNPVHVPLVLSHLLTADDAGPARLVPAAPAADATGASITPVHADAPRVSIIIPTRDRVDLLERCVSSILSTTEYPCLDILIVDNQSVEDATHAYFASVVEDARVRVVGYDRPFNYSAINNFAVSLVDADLVALVNNDIEVISPGWLAEMARHAMRKDVGAVGAMLYYPDNTIQHAGVVVGLGGVAGHAHAHLPRGSAKLGCHARHARSVSAVTAACLVVRRDAYLAAGGLDESLGVAFNDVDFCLRLRDLGLRNVFTPHAELYHHESASRGSEDTDEKRARFAGEVQAMKTRWAAQLDADPYYNANLSLDVGRDYALADPLRAGLALFSSRVAQRADPPVPSVVEPGVHRV